MIAYLSGLIAIKYPYITKGIFVVIEKKYTYIYISDLIYTSNLLSFI